MTNQVLREMILYFGNDVRRINHSLKVYSLAQAIGKSENLSDEKQLILETAAILHDIGIKQAEKKHGSSSGGYQEVEGPPVASEILQKLGADQDMIDRVCYIIGNHHTYNKVDDIDFQILVEADFLVNIYEDEIEKYAILGIKDKYFKTQSGRKLIDSMYLK